MKRHLLGIAALSISGASAAAPYQDLDVLDGRVAATLSGSAVAVPIDRRIKLAACPQEPQISAPSSGAVSVRCPALGWKLRVTVTRTTDATTGALADVLVHRGDAIQLIARGSGYSVTSVGIALEEGTSGASIRVKIPTSASPLAAVVDHAGLASISY